jgi:cell wall-associated NlpC family hydrolase
MAPNRRTVSVAPLRPVLTAALVRALGGAACIAVSAMAAGAQADGPALAATQPAARTPRMTPVRKAPLAAIEARGPNPAGPFARLNEVQRDSIVENLRSMLGVRYKWAGEKPERGLDCSGLVRYVFARLGIDLPHSSQQLARLGASVGRDTSEMRPGDLLVFSKKQSKRISHVGIYVGDGMMIHASSTSKQVVETPIVEYKGLLLRSVRRVFAVDSAASPSAIRQ